MKEQKVVAKHISKHIAMYWNKIDKIVVFKHKGYLQCDALVVVSCTSVAAS